VKTKEAEIKPSEPEQDNACEGKRKLLELNSAVSFGGLLYYIFGCIPFRVNKLINKPPLLVVFV
jgi:hypothetical protein